MVLEVGVPLFVPGDALVKGVRVAVGFDSPKSPISIFFCDFGPVDLEVDRRMGGVEISATGRFLFLGVLVLEGPACGISSSSILSSGSSILRWIFAWPLLMTSKVIGTACYCPRLKSAEHETALDAIKRSALISEYLVPASQPGRGPNRDASVPEITVYGK